MAGTGWKARTVVGAGVELHCRDWAGDPAGRPVLLLHGLAGHAGEWDALAGALAPAHRVVAVDQRGHGRSTRRPGSVDRAAYVADALAVADRLGLERPLLVGQSLGGHTALLAAAAHPDRFGALALVEAAAGRSPGLPEQVGGMLRGWPLPFPDRAAAVGFFGGGPVGEAWADGLEQRPDGWWPRFDTEVMVESLAPLAARDHWADWAALTCPTLLVLGRRGIIPAAETDRMLALRPEVRAVSLPGAGHDVHLEHPAELSRLLAELLHDLDAGAL
ncbi:alpha/beta fold hydrolase [Kitasatospora phosalacinea]|uniref:alpha/beta fold hydrolase n=1 Tax=Kitasatospora phosalacinea TaxID=2065 RepID=UPI0005242ACB|nr:alpha/beta hydrolase [Kitasatospora phosalacinea]